VEHVRKTVRVVYRSKWTKADRLTRRVQIGSSGLCPHTILQDYFVDQNVEVKNQVVQYVIIFHY
jgi:hypothetical protein